MPQNDACTVHLVRTPIGSDRHALPRLLTGHLRVLRWRSQYHTFFRSTCRASTTFSTLNLDLKIGNAHGLKVNLRSRLPRCNSRITSVHLHVRHRGVVVWSDLPHKVNYDWQHVARVQTWGRQELGSTNAFTHHVVMACQSVGPIANQCRLCAGVVPRAQSAI